MHRKHFKFFTFHAIASLVVFILLSILIFTPLITSAFWEWTYVNSLEGVGGEARDMGSGNSGQTVNNVIATPTDLRNTNQLPPEGEFKPLTNLPGLTDNVKSRTLSDYVNVLFRIAIGIGALIAVVRIVIAGIKYMGQESIFAKGEAIKDIQTSLFGLLIMLSTVVVLSVIYPNILNINILNRGPNGLQPISVQSAVTTTAAGNTSGTPAPRPVLPPPPPAIVQAGETRLLDGRTLDVVGRGPSAFQAGTNSDLDKYRSDCQTAGGDLVTNPNPNLFRGGSRTFDITFRVSCHGGTAGQVTESNTDTQHADVTVGSEMPISASDSNVGTPIQSEAQTAAVTPSQMFQRIQTSTGGQSGNMPQQPPFSFSYKPSEETCQNCWGDIGTVNSFVGWCSQFGSTPTQTTTGDTVTFTCPAS